MSSLKYPVRLMLEENQQEHDLFDYSLSKISEQLFKFKEYLETYEQNLLQFGDLDTNVLEKMPLYIKLLSPLYPQCVFYSSESELSQSFRKVKFYRGAILLLKCDIVSILIEAIKDRSFQGLYNKVASLIKQRLNGVEQDCYILDKHYEQAFFNKAVTDFRLAATGGLRNFLCLSAHIQVKLELPDALSSEEVGRFERECWKQFHALPLIRVNGSNVTINGIKVNLGKDRRLKDLFLRVVKAPMHSYSLLDLADEFWPKIVCKVRESISELFFDPESKEKFFINELLQEIKKPFEKEQSKINKAFKSALQILDASIFRKTENIIFIDLNAVRVEIDNSGRF